MEDLIEALKKEKLDLRMQLDDALTDRDDMSDMKERLEHEVDELKEKYITTCKYIRA
jgi:hypothetical protein